MNQYKNAQHINKNISIQTKNAEAWASIVHSIILRKILRHPLQYLTNRS